MFSLSISLCWFVELTSILEMGRNVHGRAIKACNVNFATIPEYLETEAA
jgi:hypothetical protein